MNTMIAIPCMDEIPYQFVESLIALRPVGNCTVQFLSGSLIYDARNQLAERAIEKGFDYILWLDSDMVFDEDLLERMFASIGDKDFLTGMYYTRRAQPYKPCIFAKVGYVQEEGYTAPMFEWYLNPPSHGLFEVEACGFGCVLVKTSVCADVQQKLGLPFYPKPGFGEDIAFCMRATELGYKLWCDPEIQLGHIGRNVIGNLSALNEGRTKNV